MKDSRFCATIVQRIVKLCGEQNSLVESLDNLNGRAISVLNLVLKILHLESTNRPSGASGMSSMRCLVVDRAGLVEHVPREERRRSSFHIQRQQQTVRYMEPFHHRRVPSAVHHLLSSLGDVPCHEISEEFISNLGSVAVKPKHVGSGCRLKH